MASAKPNPMVSVMLASLQFMNNVRNLCNRLEFKEFKSGCHLAGVSRMLRNLATI